MKFEGGVYHLIGAGDSPALTIQGDVATAAAVQFVLETGAVHGGRRAKAGDPTQSRRAIYHVDNATGGVAKAGLHGEAHD
ncbi:MAG: hypothetical protein M1482_09615, partial [Chloroflexi bacterium]|nr:hypothetical protein [Chloroflexota bacterium]